MQVLITSAVLLIVWFSISYPGKFYFPAKKDWIDGIEAVGPLIIGVFALYLALEQNRINKKIQQQNEKQYYYESYLAVNQALKSIAKTGEINEHVMEELWDTLWKARLLLDDDIIKFLDEVTKNAYTVLDNTGTLKLFTDKGYAVTSGKPAEIDAKRHEALLKLFKTDPVPIYKKYLKDL